MKTTIACTLAFFATFALAATKSGQIESVTVGKRDIQQDRVVRLLCESLFGDGNASCQIDLITFE